MVNYTTQAEMQLIYGTGRISTLFSKDDTKVISSGIFNAIKSRAQAYVNSKLGQQYSDDIPFSTGNVPVIVQTWTEIIMFKIAGPARRNKTTGIDELITLYNDLFTQLDEGKATIEGLSSVIHTNPFFTNENGVRELRRSVLNAQGDRVNESEFDSISQVGELDIW